ncbi:MAG TPA: hypothetical protein VJ941_11545 [Gracilimonas sp.]|nr:hypothetical protein [Gracilimonas sp.]
MKKNSNSFLMKVSKACKAHFNNNPNDLIALYFGIFVLAFILLITPQIPQNTISTYADQTEVEEEPAQLVNTEEAERSADKDSDEKLILQATLK